MANWSGASVLFEDTLTIDSIDLEGKMFQNVSRIKGNTQIYKVGIILDIHSELYPVSLNEYHSITLASSLSPDGTADTNEYILHEENPQLQKYDYCMYGQVYRHSLEKGLLNVLVSFGGLLMSLSGTTTDLQQLELDSQVYLLLKKLSQIPSAKIFTNARKEPFSHCIKIFPSPGVKKLLELIANPAS